MILVTGGMGFIGLHTARRFVDSGEEVLLSQHHSRREPEFLKDLLGERLHLVPLDVTDRDALATVLRQHNVTGIAHLVAPALNALSPDDDFNTSVIGLLNVLQAARQAQVKRVTLASSVAVYSGLSGGPFREDALLPIESRSPTETFKKSWEILGLHYAERTGLDVVAMRIGSIYGPLFWHGGIFPVVRLCYAAVRGTGIGEGPELFAGDQSSPCYVTDCAMGIELLQHAGTLKHRIYNVGVGWSLTNQQIVAAIRQAVPNFEVELKPGSSPRNRPSPYLDPTRMREDTGYEPQYDISCAVAEYIAWLRAHPEESMTVERRSGALP